MTHYDEHDEQAAMGRARWNHLNEQLDEYRVRRERILELYRDGSYEDGAEFGSGVAKWMRDPVSGGHEWTNKERDAVEKVRWVERAMALGAGGTGGFLVPYELDPQVILSGVGAVSPLRQIARVITTAQNEKRVVTSLGSTASWDLEAE